MTITNEELKRLLELAALALGLELGLWNDGNEPYSSGIGFVLASNAIWNPHANSGQCAEMNAALGHDDCWRDGFVHVYLRDAWGFCEPHDGTTQDKLRAWREASLRAAAKVGEWMEQESGK